MADTEPMEQYKGASIRCIARKAGTKVTITYDANGGTGAPSPTSGSSEQLPFKITLSSTVPTKSGFTFVGWNTNTSGTGSWYNAGDTISVDRDVTLYAIWWTETTSFDSAFASAGKSKVTGTDYYAMQDMTASICSNVTSATFPTIAASTQLIDTRDNKLYWVSKLADGKCWMTQNLDLNLSTSKTLTTSDSNVSSDWTPERSTITTSSSSTISGWTDDYNNPYSADRGNYYLTEGGSSSTLNAITCTATNNGGENCHYHLGNHYNWSAAVASNDTSGSTTQYTNMPNSICPKGWRLPQGYSGTPSSHSTGDFTTLNNAYGGITNNDNTLRSKPLWFVRSGNVVSGSLNFVGSLGFCWSSTVYNNSIRAYNLYFYSSGVSPAYNYLRDYGISVRCVAQ